MNVFLNSFVWGDWTPHQNIYFYDFNLIFHFIIERRKRASNIIRRQFNIFYIKNNDD